MFIKKIIKIIIIIFLLLSCISIFIGNYFYRYAFHPDSSYNVLDTLNIKEKKYNDDINFKEIELESHDHLILKGYYLNNHSDITLLMVHGYRSNYYSLIDTANRLNQYNLLDILLWIDYLINHNHQFIYLYGVSMGGATVLNTSAYPLPLQVKGIISDCAYTSVVDVIKEHIDMNIINQTLLKLLDFMTYIQANYHLEDKRPIEQVQYSQVPILYIHGENDEYISFKHAYKLYQQTSSLKHLLIIKDAKHGTCFQYHQFYEVIHSFIKQYTKSNQLRNEFDKIY